MARSPLQQIARLKKQLAKLDQKAEVKKLREQVQNKRLAMITGKKR